MARPKPTCQKCGGRHYNFVACAEADAANAREEAAAEARARAEAADAARMGHVNQFAGIRSQNYVVTGGGDQPLVFRRRREGDLWRAG